MNDSDNYATFYKLNDESHVAKYHWPGIEYAYTVSRRCDLKWLFPG